MSGVQSLAPTEGYHSNNNNNNDNYYYYYDNDNNNNNNIYTHLTHYKCNIVILVGIARHLLAREGLADALEDVHGVVGHLFLMHLIYIFFSLLDTMFFLLMLFVILFVTCCCLL